MKNNEKPDWRAKVSQRKVTSPRCVKRPFAAWSAVSEVGLALCWLPEWIWDYTILAKCAS